MSITEYTKQVTLKWRDKRWEAAGSTDVTTLTCANLDDGHIHASLWRTTYTVVFYLRGTYKLDRRWGYSWNWTCVGGDTLHWSGATMIERTCTINRSNNPQLIFPGEKEMALLYLWTMIDIPGKEMDGRVTGATCIWQCSYYNEQQKSIVDLEILLFHLSWKSEREPLTLDYTLGWFMEPSRYSVTFHFSRRFWDMSHEFLGTCSLLDPRSGHCLAFCVSLFFAGCLGSEEEWGYVNTIRPVKKSETKNFKRPATSRVKEYVCKLLTSGE